MPSFKNLSPPALQSNLQFFFHMLEASFVILIKLPLFSPSFPPPFLFIALPWARHSICGGIQSKKKMELQGEIDTSTIIVGDFNTPLSVIDRKRKEKKKLWRASSLVGSYRYIPSVMGQVISEPTNRFSLCYGWRMIKRVWEGFFSQTVSSTRAQSCWHQTQRLSIGWWWVGK